ncbi:hypothetical protein ABC733_17995 [Mangrovibacter sp. SLW1]
MGTNIIKPGYTRISMLILIESGRMVRVKSKKSLEDTRFQTQKSHPQVAYFASFGAKAGLKSLFNDMKNIDNLKQAMISAPFCAPMLFVPLQNPTANGKLSNFSWLGSVYRILTRTIHHMGLTLHSMPKLMPLVVGEKVF